MPRDATVVFTSGVPASITTGDKVAVPCAEGFVVVEAGIYVTTAMDNTPTAIVVKFDKINTAGSRGDGDFAPNLTKATDVEAGKVLRRYMNARILRGEAVVMECTTAPGAGAGIFYLRGYYEGTSGADAADVASD
jgi:hypothetical protein